MSENKHSSVCTINPEIGRLTWDSEGHEGGRYHSRVLHVPTESSGVTIGRGYDLKMRNSGEIETTLRQSLIDEKQIPKLIKAIGLKGEEAKKFIRDSNLSDFEIEPLSQRILFDISYDQKLSDAKRLCTKKDVRQKFKGECDWGNMDPVLKAFVVDLNFRGDYGPTTREKIQEFINDGNIKAILDSLKTDTHWRGVPPVRHEARKKLLQQRLIDLEKEKKKAGIFK